MPWWVWSVLAALTAIGVEYLNRTVGAGRTFAATLPYTILPIAFLQLGLHGSYSRAPTIIMAWAVFFVTTCASRLALAYFVLHEIPSTLQLTGVFLIVAGACAVKAG